MGVYHCAANGNPYPDAYAQGRTDKHAHHIYSHSYCHASSTNRYADVHSFINGYCNTGPYTNAHISSVDCNANRDKYTQGPAHEYAYTHSYGHASSANSHVDSDHYTQRPAHEYADGHIHPVANGYSNECSGESTADGR